MFKRPKSPRSGPARKPDWVQALEANDVEAFRLYCIALSLPLPLSPIPLLLSPSIVEARGGRPPPPYEGCLGALQVAGRWSALGAACFFDSGEAVEVLLHSRADPDAIFHRLGTSFSAMAYCQKHDKNNAYRALVAGLQALNDIRNA